MWLKTVLFVSAEGDSENSVFTHHEFAVFQFLLEAFEIVSGHVFEGKDIQILVLVHESVNSVDNVLFMLSFFGFSLSQRDELISFSFRHQQL